MRDYLIAYAPDESPLWVIAIEALLNPHFLSRGPKSAMEQATTALHDDAVKVVYERFQSDREAEIITEIRRVCGVAGEARA